MDYATTDYTAFAGVDYVATSGTLTFAAGDTTKTFTVTVLGNTIPEDTKYFTVQLSGVSANASVGPAAYGAIYDDDGYYYDYGYGNDYYYDYYGYWG